MSSIKAKPVEAAAAETKPAPPITIDLKVHVQAIALLEADGRYSIVVPALPGCVSEADTLDDVQAQITESAEAWLASMHGRNRDEDIRIMRGE